MTLQILFHQEYQTNPYNRTKEAILKILIVIEQILKKIKNGHWDKTKTVLYFDLFSC